ncbi:uncharacterized protein BXZ73DRAFT_98314 [Epithele typhae]|uniref:uncharacterized protein n=1 Tax=Epithele typhae TaxID=378194 RepID=UPI002008D869|nr:uncharacterized protein BXZ73DRAFT_98314 [Epithele typhae]KAH9941103.1 hypothetical protein BXZ73DRAFT_98314 [Epithele typhae]
MARNSDYVRHPSVEAEAKGESDADVAPDWLEKENGGQCLLLDISHSACPNDISTPGPPSPSTGLANVLERHSALLLLVMFTLVNAMLLAAPRGTSAPAAPLSPAKLDFAKTFRDPAVPHPPSTTNLPVFVAHLDRARPAGSFADESAPEAYRGEVSPQRSLLVQYFVGDVGTARCALEVRVPAADCDASPVFPAWVQAWRVETEQRVLETRDLASLSRTKRLAAWTLEARGTFVSEEFECEARSFHAFKLACAGAETSVAVNVALSHRRS